jgi:hypothetical protein
MVMALFLAVAAAEATPSGDAPDQWHLGLAAGAGLAHELVSIDLQVRYRHLEIFIPFGPLGIANNFIDGAPTIAGGLRWLSGDGQGVTVSLQGAAVWTPVSQSAADAGFVGSLALTAGGRARSGHWFAQAAAGPIASYEDHPISSPSHAANGFSWGSLPHGRNWYRSWPIDLDVAIGYEF